MLSAREQGRCVLGVRGRGGGLPQGGANRGGAPPYPINPSSGANNQFSILIIYHSLADRGIYFSRRCRDEKLKNLGDVRKRKR